MDSHSSSLPAYVCEICNRVYAEQKGLCRRRRHNPECQKSRLALPPPDNVISASSNDTTKLIDQTNNKLRKAVRSASSANDDRVKRTSITISDLFTAGGSAKLVREVTKAIEEFEMAKEHDESTGDNGNLGNYNLYPNHRQLPQRQQQEHQQQIECKVCVEEFARIRSPKQHTNVQKKPFLCMTSQKSYTSRRSFDSHKMKSNRCQNGERLSLPSVNKNSENSNITKSVDRLSEPNPMNGQFSGVQDLIRFWNSIKYNELTSIDLNRNGNDFAEGFNIRSRDDSFDNHSDQIRPIEAKGNEMNVVPRDAALNSATSKSDDGLIAPEQVETPGLDHFTAIPPTLDVLSMQAPPQLHKSKSNGEIDDTKRKKRNGFSIDELLNSK